MWADSTGSARDRGIATVAEIVGCTGLISYETAQASLCLHATAGETTTPSWSSSAGDSSTMPTSSEEHARMVNLGVISDSGAH